MWRSCFTIWIGGPAFDVRSTRGDDRKKGDRDRPEGSVRPFPAVLIIVGLCLFLVPACQQSVVGVRGQPSVEAPPRASQARHHYRYFPESAVYMDTGRRIFYYRKGEKWLSTTLLPAGVQVDWKDYVVIELDTDRPYLFHAETAKKYPRKSGPGGPPGKAAN